MSTWIGLLISEDDSFLSHKVGVVGIYSHLQDEFLKDAQVVMQQLAKDVLKAKLEKAKV